MQSYPLELLEQATRILRKYECRYILVGGLAVSIYRREPRLTQDVDIALLALNSKKSESIAISLVEELGFKASKAKASQLNRAPAMNKKNSPVVLIVGRKPKENILSGLDVLLPTMPWVKNAVERSQKNEIDFGFAKIPVITIEDLIIAKLFSLNDNISRYKDLDDLQDILLHTEDLDMIYLVKSLEKYRLTIPKELKNCVARELKVFLKGV